MFNLGQLEYFYYVVKYGGFTEAARRLPFPIKQPALSLRVKALEENLQVKLYQIVGRKLRLTSNGEYLFNTIQPFFESLDDLERQLKGEAHGRLIVAEAAPMLILKEHQSVLKEFRRRHPGVQLSILEKNWTNLLESVTEGEVDLAFGSAPELRGNISFEEWLEGDYLLLHGSKHPIGKDKSVGLKSIASYPLILLERGTADRQHIENIFSRNKISFEVALETSSYSLINEAVKDGVGIAIVNEFWPRPGRMGGLRTQSVSHLFGKKRIGLFQRTDKYLPPYALEFLSLVKEKSAVQASGAS
ncbi:MAG: LysR family transcriptional regulator [bacterium]|nr:LysR family transcriptional regulator [bacterium]